MITNSIDRGIRIVGMFSALVLISLVALILYDATMRYFFSSGSIMLQELEWHLFDLIMLFSIAFTLQYNRHVRVDIIYQNYSAKTKKLVDLVGYIFMVIPFSLLILYVGYEFVLMSFEQMEGSANPGGLPYRFIIKSSMLLGFVLLALQALSESIKYFISQSRAV